MGGAPWLNFAVALGIGLLIGVERERSKGEGPNRRAAGIRSFGIASLVGALAFHVGGGLTLAVAVGGVAMLAALSYVRSRDDDPGLTTEAALLSAPLLGALAMRDSILASAAGVAVAVLLAAKASAHRFAKRTLTDAEIKDALVFAIATVIVWPQLPDHAMGPFQALNPHAIWTLVILVLAIGSGGHVLTRLVGPRYGLALAGLASGFVSSMATIGSMAGVAAKNPNEMRPAVAGATLSTVATFIQLALLLGVVSMPTLNAIWPAILAGGVVAILYGLGFTLLALRTHEVEGASAGRAFSIKTALVLAATLCIMLIAASWLRQTFGEKGIVLGAAVAGFVDPHAASISIASLVTSGKLAPADTLVPILTAMTANVIAKIVMAFSTGRLAFGLRVAPGLVLSMALAWLAAAPLIVR